MNEYELIYRRTDHKKAHPFGILSNRRRVKESIKNIKLHTNTLTITATLNGTPRSSGIDETISGKKNAGEKVFRYSWIYGLPTSGYPSATS